MNHFRLCSSLILLDKKEKKGKKIPCEHVVTISVAFWMSVASSVEDLKPVGHRFYKCVFVKKTKKESRDDKKTLQ